jgi:hypothetical protein
LRSVGAFCTMFKTLGIPLTIYAIFATRGDPNDPNWFEDDTKRVSK